MGKKAKKEIVPETDPQLQLLRQSVDLAEANVKAEEAEKIKTPEMQRLITLVEQFIARKKLICYGGTAINNILPANDQFYIKGVEIPDYDFFSTHALNDAIELADLYFAEGFSEVQAKAGMHHGTYKVFVNFIGVADITHLDEVIYKKMLPETIKVNKILYAPPNFLRMSMYLELSRPRGDVSRWEKVYKRLTLLDKHYPISKLKCQLVNFMRDFEDEKNIGKEKEAYSIVKNAVIEQDLVFIGGYASGLYGKYLDKSARKQIQEVPEFDVLAENPKAAAEVIKTRLLAGNFKNVTVNAIKPVGELIAAHMQVKIADDIVCFVYEPSGCQSYNTLTIKKQKINIATIDTLLNFYLTFLYSNRDYHEHERIMCMAQYLFEVQMQNKANNKGLLKRFNLNCYGEQETLADIRQKKTSKFMELQKQKESLEYKRWFLNYEPGKLKTDKEKKGAQEKKDAPTFKNKTLRKKKARSFLPRSPSARSPSARSPSASASKSVSARTPSASASVSPSASASVSPSASASARTPSASVSPSASASARTSSASASARTPSASASPLASSEYIENKKFRTRKRKQFHTRKPFYKRKRLQTQKNMVLKEEPGFFQSLLNKFTGL
jgi:hypothetical protein